MTLRLPRAPRLSLFALVVALAACETTENRGRNLDSGIFEDIPAPRDAVYHHDRAESFSWSGESFRCGRFQFESHGRHEDAVRFFNETMTRPPYSWQPVKSTREREGSARLEFRKGDDHCTVDIDYVHRHASVGDSVNILVRVNCLR